MTKPEPRRDYRACSLRFVANRNVKRFYTVFFSVSDIMIAMENFIIDNPVSEASF